MGIISSVRTVIFYLLLALVTLLWLPPSLLVGPALPYSWRYRLIAVAWGRVVLFLSRWVLGIRYRVRGLENVPQQPCVILSKHQSAWETFFLSSHFEPLSQVLKRELLHIPVFGWALAMIKPIAINREQPKQALKQVAEQGAARLARGNWLLIFPEGTRVPPGQIGKFSRGGVSLAVNAGLPVLPVAHNAGQFWPKLDWRKQPGVVDVVIGPVMHAEGTGLAAIAELNRRAFLWVAQTQHEIGSLTDANWQAIKEQHEGQGTAD